MLGTKKEDVNRLQKTEMRMIRMMCGKTLGDRCRNEDLRKEVNVKDIEDFLREHRLRWFGHVERRDTRNMTRRVSELVDGERSRGRPKKSWNELVKEDLKKLNIDKRLLHDRCEWRRQCRQVVDPGMPGSDHAS